MSGRENRPRPCGPYEAEQQGRADVALIHEQARRSVRRGVLAKANYACQDANVMLGAYDGEILAWRANYEPETCAVIVFLARALA